jgi:hypothetical protein
MTPRKSVLLISALVVLWAGQALALDVYLNGVLITGVRNQEIQNATVQLDAQGNVKILAPSYRVEREDTTQNGPAGTTKIQSSSGSPTTTTTTIAPQRPTSSSTADQPPPGGGSGLSRRYWLVAEVNGPGMVQYRIEVRVNGLLVRSFTDADAPPPIEVTDYLRPGSNNVRITADKLNDGARQSDSSRYWIRVVVSDGHIEGSAVVIDRPGVIFTRNAAQTDRASREFELLAE